MRVVMFTSHPGLPWELDWAKAAATVAEVVRVSEVRHLTWPAVPESGFLARDPHDPLHYQVQAVQWRPSRLLGRIARRITARRYAAATRHVMRVHGPVDVLHGHFYWSTFLPALHRSLGVPYVVTEHHTAWQGHWSVPAPTRLGLRWARQLYAEAACVITVCESLRQRLRDFGMEGNFRVVPNPVDTSDFPLVASAPAGDRIEIVSVGRLSPAKGFDILLEALAIARTRVPGLHLSIVGDGSDQLELEQLRSRLGLDGAADFLGRQSRTQIGELLGRAHLFALASRAENLTVAVVEALAAGLPVVTTSVGGHPELVDERVGRLAPPEDASEFALALLEVVANQARFDRAQIAAETRARFSLDQIGAQLAAIYGAARAGGAPIAQGHSNLA
jgi:glycosyltransferase involved in cell wall biosynthesis